MSSSPENHRILTSRVHFVMTPDMWEFVSSRITDTRHYTETLYDTEDYQLLANQRWYWRQPSGWCLKERASNPCDSTTGHSESVQYNLYENEAASVRVEQATGAAPLFPVISLNTRRMFVTESFWIDFTTWSRWRRGYYAVASATAPSYNECLELARSMFEGQFTLQRSAGKALVCLQFTQPRVLEGAKLSDEELALATVGVRFVTTDNPLFGPRAPKPAYCDECISSGDYSDDE